MWRPVSRMPLMQGDRPTSSTDTFQQSPPEYLRYGRKFSFIERLTKLVTSPDEAMEDIGLAPDYRGVIVLFVIWAIIGFIGVALALPKLQFVGTYGDAMNSVVMSNAIMATMLTPIILIVRWLVKSFLIRYLTNSKSWNFETAASVTGYAYLPSVMLNVVGIILSWFLIPPVIIDITDLAQATVQLQAYSASILWVSIGINSLLAIVALIWKSSLGSRGTYYGTRKKVEHSSGFATFMIVGFIGFLIDFFGNFL